MNTFQRFSAALALLALAAGAQATVEPFRVNGEVVTQDRQTALLDALAQQGRVRDAKLEADVKAALTRETVLMQAAIRAKIPELKDVQARIEASRKQILFAAYAQDWIAKNPVPEAELHKVFDAEKKRWGSREVLVRHILVHTESQARDILERIHSGKKFEELAALYSLDSVPNRRAGGLIGWTSPGVFDPAFVAGFKTLKKGEMTEKPVRTPLGWHIIRFEGERPAQRWTSFEKEAPALRALLNQQRLAKHVDDLVKTAQVADGPKGARTGQPRRR